MEVYLRCSVNKCAQRDYKGHYEKAFNGDYDMFVGVTDEYEISDNPEFILDTEEMSIEGCASLLIEKCINFLKNNE
jgi:adenylylsulfate kinase